MKSQRLWGENNIGGIGEKAYLDILDTRWSTLLMTELGGLIGSETHTGSFSLNESQNILHHQHLTTSTKSKTKETKRRTRSLLFNKPGLTSLNNCKRPRAAVTTPLSLLFLYSIKSPNRSSSMHHGCRLQTSRIPFRPAATTSDPTPG